MKYTSGFNMIHVSLIDDRSPVASSRRAQAYSGAGGTPTVFFDAGHTASVGGFLWSDVINNGYSLVPYYTPEIEAAGLRTVPALDLVTAIDWLGDNTVRVHLAIAFEADANTAPSTPAVPTGPSSLTADQVSSFETTAIDDEGNRVCYMWDWGDGEVSNWSDPHVQGTTVSASHSWAIEADYEIRVKVKDPFGLQSDWSAPMPISVACCSGRVGNANGMGTDEPTIGDVSVMIDAKFITGTCAGVFECMTEADVNQSGGTNPDCGDITIGDISILIDYLFITGTSLGVPDCL